MTRFRPFRTAGRVSEPRLHPGDKQALPRSTRPSIFFESAHDRAAAQIPDRTGHWADAWSDATKAHGFRNFGKRGQTAEWSPGSRPFEHLRRGHPHLFGDGLEDPVSVRLAEQRLGIACGLTQSTRIPLGPSS